MAAKYIVDGSNIATEGRSSPSLAQLDEAVRAFAEEHPDDEVIVVVDASFEYRIDESEQKAFEEAEAAGEIVSPPAGAIGRGDGFLLQIADRTGATVLSNDSFQEFHGEYDWLFDKGRLIGGKPVPGVGWIFMSRTPVRGPKSRMAVQEAKRTRARVGSKEASQPMPKPAAPPPRGRKRGASSSDADAAAANGAKGAGGAKDGAAPVAEAIAEATADVLEPGRRRSRRGRRRTTTQPSEPVNEPLPFITFIAEHRLGDEVEGTVESFTSHGAFVTVDAARCYVPMTALADPPPRSAKEVLAKGEVRRFVVQALDPPRRGIELALPGLARLAGAPTEETVEEEIKEGGRRRRGGQARERAAEAAVMTRPEPVEEVAGVPASGPSVTEADLDAAAAAPAKKVTRKRAAATTKKEPAAKKKAPAKRKAPAARKEAAAAAKEPAKRKASAKEPAKKVAARPKKKPAAKKAAPAKKTVPTKKTVPAKNAGAASKKKTAGAAVKKKAAKKTSSS